MPTILIGIALGLLRSAKLKNAPWIIGFPPQNIPSKAILIIEGLMRADAETEPAAPIEIVNLPATCKPEQFSLYTRAYKHSECEQFKDWITTRLDAAAESELGLTALPSAERPDTQKQG